MTGFEIKQKRLIMALSQREMSLRLGVTQPTVAKMESNNDYAEKYSKQVNTLFNSWVDIRCSELQKEINFLYEQKAKEIL